MEKGIKKTDINVSIVKGVVGALPYIGPMVAEVIGNIIPNQRIDRIESFLQILDEKVKDIEGGRLKQKFNNPEIIDIFEDGLFQVVKALSKERKEYIASLIKNSISDMQAEHIQHKKLLSILNELNDIEIIILRSHLFHFHEDQEFFKKHEAILTPQSAHLGSSQEEIDKSAIYKTYSDHLVKMGLLKIRFKKPKRGELPEFDENTGMIKAQGYSITPLGKLLLRYIDLNEKK
jgi:hypothetical protein